MTLPPRHALTAALALAALTACTPTQDPTPTPTPTTPTSPVVEPSPTPSASYPGHEGEAPGFPAAFGEWRGEPDGQDRLVIDYTSPSGSLMVAYTENTSATKTWVAGNSTALGNWLCKSNGAGVAIVTPTHGREWFLSTAPPRPRKSLSRSATNS